MIEYLYNTCYGGFSFSKEFVEIDEYGGMERVSIDWQSIYAKICHDLVRVIKNNEDTTALLQEYDEVYAECFSKK